MSTPTFAESLSSVLSDIGTILSSMFQWISNVFNAVRVWRFALGVVAVYFGGWGILIGAASLLIHLASLRCLDVCYLTPWPSPRGLLRRRIIKEKREDEGRWTNNKKEDKTPKND